MKRSKIDGLTTAGWKVGTAAEFLALSDEETARIASSKIHSNGS